MNEAFLKQRVCLKHKRVIRDQDEYERYLKAREEYPEFIDEDYDPYTSVCVEWGAMADVSPLDRFIYAMEPTDTPLTSLLASQKKANSPIPDID